MKLRLTRTCAIGCGSRDTERLVRLRDEDRILIYEVEESPSPDLRLHYGFLYHRVDSNLTGDPFLFTFDEKTTCLR